MDDADAGYIVEFLVMGRSVKVTAVDPATGREVSMVGSALFPRKMLARQAVRKLQYVLNRDNA